MATTPFSFRPTGIRVCASSGHRKEYSTRRKASSSSWWTPLFGWSSEPDYIGESSSSSSDKDPSEKARIGSDSDPGKTRSGPRFAPGCFTEEKAKMLRMKTTETETFHDIMYHSAIASRLASDFSNLSGR